jgi:hypothetical protein
MNLCDVLIDKKIRASIAKVAHVSPRRVFLYEGTSDEKEYEVRGWIAPKMPGKMKDFEKASLEAARDISVWRVFVFRKHEGIEGYYAVERKGN